MATGSSSSAVLFQYRSLHTLCLGNEINYILDLFVSKLCFSIGALQPVSSRGRNINPLAWLLAG